MNAKERRNNEILLLIAEKGPLNKYRICETLVPKHGSEPTILYAVDDLEKAGLIKVAEIKTNARGPTGQSKHYVLDVKGFMSLVSVLERTENSDQIVQQLVRKYGALVPGIFDYWPAIEEVQAEGMARQRLRAVFNDALVNYRILMRHTNNSNPIRIGLYTTSPSDITTSSISTLLDEATDDFWDPTLLIGGQQDWLKVISGNRLLQEATAHTVVKRVHRKMREANKILETIGSQKLELETETLGEDLQLAAKMLNKLKTHVNTTWCERCGGNNFDSGYVSGTDEEIEVCMDCHTSDVMQGTLAEYEAFIKEKGLKSFLPLNLDGTPHECEDRKNLQQVANHDTSEEHKTIAKASKNG